MRNRYTSQYILFWVLLPFSLFLLLFAMPGCSSGKNEAFARDTAAIHRNLAQGYDLLAENDTSQWLQALHKSQSGRKRSTELNYQKGQADNFILEAQVHHKSGRIQEARNCQKKAINILKQHGFTGDLATAYGQLAGMYDLYSDERKQRIAYFEEAARLYGLAGRHEEQGNILQQVGDFCMIDDDHLKAQRVLYNAIEIYDSIQYRPQQGAYTLLNQVFINLGNFHKAIESGRRALAFAQEVNDTSGQLSTIYNRIGIAQQYLGLYDSAQHSFSQALMISKRVKDQSAVNILVRNLADTYFKSGKFNECIAVAQQHLSQIPDLSREQKSALYLFILHGHIGKNDHSAAEKYYQHLLSSIPENTRDNYELYAYLAMIQHKLNSGSFTDAKSLIKKAESLYRQHQLTNALKRVYALQYKVDSAEGNFKSAMASQNKLKEVSDSIFLANQEQQVASLEKQFQSEVALHDQLKEQNIELLRTKGKLQEAQLGQAHTHTYFLMGGLLLTVAVLIFGYRIYRSKQRNNRLLEKQKKEIDQQNISLKRLVDQQVKLLLEKEWLIKEVHHRVKNNLQIIVSLLNFQSKTLKDENARIAIRDSQHRVNAMSFIHQRLYKTNNMEVISIGSYISDLVQYLKEALNSNKTIDFELEVIPVDLPVAQVVPIGLILNEAITNSVKYAFEGRSNPRITIGLDNDGPEHFLLKIADNGTGICDTVENGRFDTLGFSLMQTMAEQLESEFNIENNNGLTLTFRFRQEPIHIHPTKTSTSYA